MSVQKDSVTDKQTCMIDLLSITDAPVIMMNDPHTESVTSKKKAENNRGHVFNSQEEQCPKPALNHSLSSASSASSQRSFSERVKISSKHLKEIKSPFDTNGNLKTSDKVDLSNEFRVSKPHKEKDKNEANRLNEKSLPPTRSNQHQPRQEKIGLLTNDSVNISIIKHTAAGEEQTTIKNRSSSPLSITSVHAESCKDTSHGRLLLYLSFQVTYLHQKVIRFYQWILSNAQNSQ